MMGLRTANVIGHSFQTGEERTWQPCPTRQLCTLHMDVETRVWSFNRHFGDVPYPVPNPVWSCETCLNLKVPITEVVLRLSLNLALNAACCKPLAFDFHKALMFVVVSTLAFRLPQAQGTPAQAPLACFCCFSPLPARARPSDTPPVHPTYRKITVRRQDDRPRDEKLAAPIFSRKCVSRVARLPSVKPTRTFARVWSVHFT